MSIKDLISELTRYPDDTEVAMTGEQYPLSGEFRYNSNKGTLIILTSGDYEDMS